MERIELDEFTECLKKSWSLENYERLEKFIEKIEAEKNHDKRLSEGLQGALEYILYKTPMNGLHMIWFLSALASVFPNEKYINLILKQALYNEDYSPVKEYLSYQIKSFLFNQPEYAGIETRRLQNELHQII